jgi:hypothetical protein
LGFQRVDQFYHVFHDFPLGIGVMGVVDSGTSIAAHIWGDGSITQPPQVEQLMPPTDG